MPHACCWFRACRTHATECRPKSLSERAARMLLAVRDVMDGIPARLALAVHVRPDGAIHIRAAALVGDATDARGKVVHATRLMPPIIGYPDDLPRLLHTLEGTWPPTGLMWLALVGRIAHIARHHLGRFGLAVQRSEQEEAARGDSAFNEGNKEEAARGNQQGGSSAMSGVISGDEWRSVAISGQSRVRMQSVPNHESGCNQWPITSPDAISGQSPVRMQEPALTSDDCREPRRRVILRRHAHAEPRANPHLEGAHGLEVGGHVI